MTERKKLIKEMIENTPAAAFVERRLVECRAVCNTPGSHYSMSPLLPPQGFIIMSAFGATFTDNAPEKFFRVGLSNQVVASINDMNSTMPFFKYFRFALNCPVFFPMPNFHSFVYEDLSQWILAPRLRIVTEIYTESSDQVDVVFSLLIHKLPPTILDAIAASEPK